MVVRGVEGLELAEGERWDRRRVAARVDRVRIVWERELLRSAVHEGIGRRVHALHLVEHDALVRERIVLVLELVVPTLLREHGRVARRSRVQNRVQVHVHQVVKVLRVLARDRVARAVGVSERVEEGLE